METKYIVKKNGPMGTSNQANAAASFFAKAHQKLQLNNNGLHDLSLRNNGGQGCSPASSRRFQVSLIMMFSTRVLKHLVKWAPTAPNNLALWIWKEMGTSISISQLNNNSLHDLSPRNCMIKHCYIKRPSKVSDLLPPPCLFYFTRLREVHKRCRNFFGRF